MRNSITKLVSIAFLGGLIGRGLRYGFNIVIARGLGLDALGLFAFGMVVMKGGGVFARVGLDTAAQKYIPIYHSEGDSARVSGTVIICLVVPLVVGAVFATILYTSRGVISELTDTTLSSATELFIVGIPLYAAMMVGVNATYGLKRTRYSVYIRDLGQSAVALVLMAIGAFVLSDLDVLITGYLVSLVVGVGLAVTFLIREGALRFDVPPIFEYQKIFAFSLPLTFAASIQYFVSWTDILVLGIFVSPEPIGWYQATYQTSVLLVVVLQSANSIFPAIAADLHESGQHDQLNCVYTAITRWVTYLTVLALMFVLVYTGDILSIFGTAVRSAQIALIILAVGQTLNAIVGPTGYLLVMTDYERLQLVNNVVAALLNLVLNLVFIQAYGIIGAAAATGLSLASLNILRLVEVRYLLGMQPYSRGYWKGAVAIGGTLPVLLLGQKVPLVGILRVAIVGSIAFGVFASLIWLLGFDDVDKSLIEVVD
jgi:O-antigen/teichoic acid export membrane protein